MTNRKINFDKFTSKELQEWGQLMAQQHSNAMGEDIKPCNTTIQDPAEFNPWLDTSKLYEERTKDGVNVDDVE
jgi:hypothetical protein